MTIEFLVAESEHGSPHLVPGVPQAVELGVGVAGPHVEPVELRPVPQSRRRSSRQIYGGCLIRDGGS
jgi:hypothetical protein